MCMLKAFLQNFFLLLIPDIVQSAIDKLKEMTMY